MIKYPFVEERAVFTGESEHFIFRPMVTSESLKGRVGVIFPREISSLIKDDAGEFFTLRSNPDHCKVYATTKPIALEAATSVIKRDEARAFEKNNPWTGYAICDKLTGAFLGRGAVGAGYLPKDDANEAGVYKAAPLEEGKGEGPAEVQMGDFIVHPFIPREALYRELIRTLLVMAARFLNEGYEQNGQKVKRITVTVIDPQMHYFSGDDQKELEMRVRVLETIFGAPLGMLPPQDKRNYSEHKRLVFGCDAQDVKVRILHKRSVSENSNE